MNLTCKPPCLLMLMLSPLSGAEESAIPSTNDFQPTSWTVQAPYQESKIVSARIQGVAAHADETSTAILQVACHRSPLRPIISLHTHTDELRFNPKAYEGNGARSTGPLSLTTGALPTHTYRVQGSAETTQQHGVLFKITMPANRRELREWISKEMGGQIISIKLPSARAGGTPLIAEFALPQDSGGLREVITPCLDTRKTTPRKSS